MPSVESRPVEPATATRASAVLRREIGQEDHPGVEPLHVVELHPDGAPVTEHVDVSLAPDERVHVDLVLVDQALVGECVRDVRLDSLPDRVDDAVDGGLSIQIERLTGNVASQITAPRKTAKPSPSNTRRSSGVPSFVLMPAKKSTDAKRTTPST
jgi:hypothetical protein